MYIFRLSIDVSGEVGVLFMRHDECRWLNVPNDFWISIMSQFSNSLHWWNGNNYALFGSCSTELEICDFRLAMGNYNSSQLCPNPGKYYAYYDPLLNFLWLKDIHLFSAELSHLFSFPSQNVDFTFLIPLEVARGYAKSTKLGR